MGWIDWFLRYSICRSIGSLRSKSSVLGCVGLACWTLGVLSLHVLNCSLDECRGGIRLSGELGSFPSSCNSRWNAESTMGAWGCCSGTIEFICEVVVDSFVVTMHTVGGMLIEIFCCWFLFLWLADFPRRFRVLAEKLVDWGWYHPEYPGCTMFPTCCICPNKVDWGCTCW